MRTSPLQISGFLTTSVACSQKTGCLSKQSTAAPLLQMWHTGIAGKKPKVASEHVGKSLAVVARREAVAGFLSSLSPLEVSAVKRHHLHGLLWATGIDKYGGVVE